MRAEARWALLFASYFAAQLVLRLLVGPALELDEAEAFWHARRLAWGYGPQPPLYFWLQWALFRVVGEGVLALALLKALLLTGTLLVAMRLLAAGLPAGAAGTAALSLGLLPQVAWEGQRALTHSVLALFLAVLTAWAFSRALASGRLLAYLLLGAIVGLGTLSKLNFMVWPAGLLLAAILLPEWRARLHPGGLALALGVAVALVLPAALWMARNPDLAGASLGKLALDGGGLAARVQGSMALASATLGFLALALAALGGFALVARGGGPWRLPPVPRLVLVASLASLGLIWLGILASGATEVRGRWLLPVAWGLAPVGVVALWPRLTRGGRRALAATTGAAWLLAAAALPYASLVDPGYRAADFGALAARLRELGGDQVPVHVTGQWVAGNLALAAPDLDVRLARDGAGGPAGAFLAVLGPDASGALVSGREVARRVAVAIDRGRSSEIVTIVVVGGG